MNARSAIKLALSVTMTVASLAAFADHIQHSLSQKYKGQIMALRHPLIGKDQQYDANGKVLSSDVEGPWTVFGRIRIEDIHVESTRLRIKAARVQFQFSQKAQGLVAVPTKHHVKLDIALSKPLSSEADADSTLATVFALTDQDVLNTAPQFWREYLSSHRASTTNHELQEGSIKERTAPVPDGKVSRLGEKGVTAPKRIYTPEPEYTDFARDAKYQGTLTLSMVVGPDGLIKNVSIVRPLGMGLDENAVASVKTWRFQPGTVNGEPVSVEMNVEVGFNLY